MSTRAKLWFGFGLLTALLALFSITVIIDLRGIQRDLYQQSEVARPRSATARQMEIYLLGYALGVRSYLHSRDASLLEERRRDADALDKSIAHYAQLANTPAQREMGARFAAGWKEYRELAERIVSRGRGTPQQLKQLVAMRTGLEQAASEIQADAQAAYEELKNATASSMRALVRLAAFLLVFGVVIGLTTAIAVSRSVLRWETSQIAQRTTTS